jgi:hypothetical protein
MICILLEYYVDRWREVLQGHQLARSPRTVESRSSSISATYTRYTAQCMPLRLEKSLRMPLATLELIGHNFEVHLRGKINSRPC